MTLMQQFIQLSLLKQSPADLPVSNSLLKLVLFGAFIVSTLASMREYSLSASALSSLADLILMMFTCWALLRINALPERYTQMVMAMAGCSIVINIVAMPIVWAYGQFESSGQIASLLLMLLIFILIWSLIIISQIFRVSLEISVGQATSLTLAYAAVSYILIHLILSGAA